MGEMTKRLLTVLLSSAITITSLVFLGPELGLFVGSAEPPEPLAIEPGQERTATANDAQANQRPAWADERIATLEGEVARAREELDAARAEVARYREGLARAREERRRQQEEQRNRVLAEQRRQAELHAARLRERSRGPKLFVGPCVMRGGSVYNGVAEFTFTVRNDGNRTIRTRAAIFVKVEYDLLLGTDTELVGEIPVEVRPGEERTFSREWNIVDPESVDGCTVRLAAAN